jgi:16S rRNA (adenine1518-N6/adenine1519-N6)-dimethyltransferase
MNNDWLAALPPLRDVIAKYDLRATKSLGQHFLLDLNLTQRIARAAGDLANCTVFEIGPGPGGLTRALLASEAKKIIAIERDDRCVNALADLVRGSTGRLDIIAADALKTDLLKLAPAPRAIVANLPYNVGTELLISWLRFMPDFRSMTLMFQAEVADRILAKPGSKDYGRLSVLCQFCCDVSRALNLPGRAFTPPPNVNSTVVHFLPRVTRPQNLKIEKLESLTAAAFGQRRKMLRSSLKSLGGEKLLAAAGIDPTLRAEDLSVTEFEKLAMLL